MEVKLVRFSRPLLIRVDDYKDDYFYQTIYGFWLKGNTDPDPVKLNQYVGYLCGLHDWASGGDYFTVSCEMRGVPDWVDKGGHTHTKMDNWMAKIGEKCRKKLGLTYDMLTVEIDEDDFLNKCINEDDLVVNEEFYYDIERFLKEKAHSPKAAPLVYDELPF